MVCAGTTTLWVVVVVETVLELVTMVVVVVGVLVLIVVDVGVLVAGVEVVVVVVGVLVLAVVVVVLVGVIVLTVVLVGVTEVLEVLSVVLDELLEVAELLGVDEPLLEPGLVVEEVGELDALEVDSLGVLEVRVDPLLDMELLSVDMEELPEEIELLMDGDREEDDGKEVVDVSSEVEEDGKLVDMVELEKEMVKIEVVLEIPLVVEVKGVVVVEGEEVLRLNGVLRVVRDVVDSVLFKGAGDGVGRRVVLDGLALGVGLKDDDWDGVGGLLGEDD